MKSVIRRMADRAQAVFARADPAARLQSEATLGALIAALNDRKLDAALRVLTGDDGHAPRPKCIGCGE